VLDRAPAAALRSGVDPHRWVALSGLGEDRSVLRRAAATGIAFASLLLSPVSVNAAQGAEMAGPWKQILSRNNSDGRLIVARLRLA